MISKRNKLISNPRSSQLETSINLYAEEKPQSITESSSKYTDIVYNSNQDYHISNRIYLRSYSNLHNTIA